jgi:ubiquinone/menaquinone biosynthesis C-methylase UbiE
VLRALAHEGVVYTQDEASQLVGRVVGAREGERVLDVCAAPGSKATQVAVLTGDRAEIVAGDLYDHRLRVVVESAARQGIENVAVVAFDAEGAALPFVEKSFDRVLVDAPCTGTGTLRHNPEIRWRLAFSDIAELAARQSLILANAARVVRPGGRLVSVAEEPPSTATEIATAYFVVKPNREQLVEIARLVDEGALRPAIDSVFPLSEAPAAFERLMSGGKRGKVVLRIVDD